MKRLISLLLLTSSSPALTGCIPMMAVSAASMAAQSARGRPVSNEGLQPQAREACAAQAAQYGSVHVVDAEQHRVDKIIVWGTVGDGNDMRSFQCDFGTKITAFTLRQVGRVP